MVLLEKVNDPSDIQDLNNEDLEILAKEIRSFIIDSVSQTGGHLGSSLGTVEITLGLHKVFDFTKDKLIWDIGHQSYTHKIITGRKNKFSSLRKKDGISGFSAPVETDYDPFIGGHSSTAISSGFGLKKGLEFQGINNNVISVIGDASIAAGMSLEAINHIGSTKSKMIIILNDNNMSISKPKGAFSKYFAKIKASTPFSYLKDTILESISKKASSPLNFIMEKADSLTRFTTEANVFEALGFSYIGIVDGHDIKTLIKIFEHIKCHEFKKPIIIHIITKKGKGHHQVEESLDCLHGVEGKDNSNIDDKNLPSNTSIFSQTLIDLAKKDNKVIGITAAMPTGTGLDKFEQEFPERFFDVGIAEQHAVTFAAGLAKSGMKPFVCIYSTFMQRAYDQVIHDVAISSLPVRFVMDRAGFVGSDGSTHAGLFDYSMFLPVPNIVFMAPSCKEDIPLMIDLMSKIEDKPSFIRISKHKHEDVRIPYNKISIGKGVIWQNGNKIAVLSIGEILKEVLKASEMLKTQDNFNITVADAKFAKPIDEELIVSLASHHEKIFVIEEGYSGIFSSMVIAILTKHKLMNKITYGSICVPDVFIEQGSIKEQKELAKIDANSLYKVFRENI